jgi:hypothetical protein
MKYMMLINLGPKARDWQQMTEEERSSLQAGFQALNQTPGVTPGIGLAPPETATTVRVQDGKTLTTDGPYVETKEALVLHVRGRGPRRGHRGGGEGAGREPRRRDRDPPDTGLDAVLRRE